MSNHREIYDFVEHWRGTEGFDITPTGNCTFPAKVTYSFDGKVVDESTSVTIIRNGYEEGKVSLNERGALSAELFHLDFSPDFQRYRHRKSDHSLRVEGSSPKMHGQYKVVITPR